MRYSKLAHGVNMDDIHHLPLLSTASIGLLVMAIAKGAMIGESVAVVAIFALTALIVEMKYSIKCNALRSK